MRDIRRSARSVRISGTESFIRPCSTLIAPMPMNSVSARSSCDESSARWPSIECIRGRTTPPSTMSSMPSRSSRTFATSSAFVMTVSRRSAISRAKASAVVPLPIAIVVSSATWAAAARAIVRFASRLGSPRPVTDGAGRQGRAAVRADEAALAGEALEVAADRGRRDAEVDGELGHARAAVGAQVVDQASATLRLPHARILRGLAHNVNSSCADRAQPLHRAQKLRTTRSSAYDAADGVPPRRGSRPRRVQSPGGTFTVLALDHRQNLRKELRPVGSRVGDRRRDGRLQARRRPGPRHDRDGRPPRPRDRRRAGDRGRLAAGARRADRRGRGDGLRGTGRGARQPRPAGLGRRAGQAARRVRGQAPRLLPPRRAQRRRPGAVRRRRRRRLPEHDLALFLEPLSFGLDGGEADRRGPAARRRRDRAPPDGARRRRAQGRVPVRRGRHRRGPLARRLRRARRGDAGPVGPALGRRRRRARSSARSGSRAGGASGVLVGRSVWAEAATLMARPATASSPRRARRGSRGWRASWTRSPHHGGRGGSPRVIPRRRHPAGTSATERGRARHRPARRRRDQPGPRRRGTRTRAPSSGRSSGSSRASASRSAARARSPRAARRASAWR